MATYNAEKLEATANALYARAFLAVMGRVLGAALLYIVWHSVTTVVIDYIHTLLTLVSLGRMKYPIVVEDQQLTLIYMSGWVLVGLVLGLSRGSELRTEAQKLLCAVEQEKHLRFIASKIGGL